MTFYPDGRPEIPNQTPIPSVPSSARGSAQGSPVEDAPVQGMSPHGSSPAASQYLGTPGPGGVPTIQEANRRRSRAMIRTIFINTAVLVTAVMLAFVRPVTDNENIRLTIGIVAAIFSALHLSAVLIHEQRRAQREALLRSAQPNALVAPEAQPTGEFAMTVEDVFTISGRGTVITGVVAAGTVRVGQNVAIARAGHPIGRTNVTGIEMFRRTVLTATAGDVAGLLLRDVTKEDVQRGDQLLF